ncbi:hypothetical protein J6590_008613 [Homalodisca vitripennis]|nr:hypothetical protein J6590_008613 [Homalodisca vitripennis]
MKNKAVKRNRTEWHHVVDSLIRLSLENSTKQPQLQVPHRIRPSACTLLIVYEISITKTPRSSSSGYPRSDQMFMSMSVSLTDMSADCRVGRAVDGLDPKVFPQRIVLLGLNLDSNLVTQCSDHFAAKYR